MPQYSKPPSNEYILYRSVVFPPLCDFLLAAPTPKHHAPVQGILPTVVSQGMASQPGNSRIQHFRSL